MSDRLKYIYKIPNHIHTIVLKQYNENEPELELYIDGIYINTIDIIKLGRKAYESKCIKNSQ